LFSSVSIRVHPWLLFLSAIPKDYNGLMQYPQIVVYETDGLLAAMLRETAKTKRWALREPRKPASCLRLLQSLCPSVLVIKMASSSGERPVLTGRLTPAARPGSEEQEQQVSVGRISNPSDREKEQVDSLELLADVHEQFPDAAVVVVADAEDMPLSHVAWDLGASYVLGPPQSRQLLPEIVSGLMENAIEKCKFSQ
jgi:hypothetical protein